MMDHYLTRKNSYTQAGRRWYSECVHLPLSRGQHLTDLSLVWQGQVPTWGRSARWWCRRGLWLHTDHDSGEEKEERNTQPIRRCGTWRAFHLAWTVSNLSGVKLNYRRRSQYTRPLLMRCDVHWEAKGNRDETKSSVRDKSTKNILLLPQYTYQNYWYLTKRKHVWVTCGRTVTGEGVMAEKSKRGRWETASNPCPNASNDLRAILVPFQRHGNLRHLGCFQHSGGLFFFSSQHLAFKGP